MSRSLSLGATLIPRLFFTTFAAYTFQSRCLSFAPESSSYNSSRTVLEYVAAGTNLSFPDNDPTCARPSQLVTVDLCRVGLSIPTSNRSSISFELWLPENWSGRFLSTGNGGIDGCRSFIPVQNISQKRRGALGGLTRDLGIKYEDLAYTTANSFAAVGSNNGHNGTTAITMYQNSDVVTDFAWRSCVSCIYYLQFPSSYPKEPRPYGGC